LKKSCAAQRLYGQLAHLPDEEQLKQLESLLEIEEGERTSRLDLPEVLLEVQA
jgi:hypothetical protein